MPNMMDPETRFLQNQEARTAALRKHSKTNGSHLFWRDLRGNLADWRNRLAAIAADQTKYKAASDRQEALHDLDQLKNECKKLQKEALATSELPVSDLRLLHQEFATCAQQLHDARNVVSPPTRFVFTRYRVAWNERVVVGKDEENITLEDELQESVKRVSRVAQGRVIQDLTDAVIDEASDGTVRMTTTESGSTDELDLSESMSLVLQNLCRCQVTITANYHLLHIINLVDCKITCSNRIDGAVHVTNCTDTTVRVSSCHQLRIHDSQRLEFHVQVGSGPILEDSSVVTFVSAPGDAMMKEIKDFNWFRSEPSPNFEVIEKEPAPLEEVNKEGPDAYAQTSALFGLETAVVSVEKEQEDEEDDDEL